MGQHLAYNIHRAKHIGVVELTDGLIRMLLERRIAAIAGIVHEHFDLAEFGNRFVDRGFDRRLVYYVEFCHEDVLEFGQFSFLAWRAHGCDDIPALVVKELCRVFADAG